MWFKKQFIIFLSSVVMVEFAQCYDGKRMKSVRKRPDGGGREPDRGGKTTERSVSGGGRKDCL